jgi:hypothetical protein
MLATTTTLSPALFVPTHTTSYAPVPVQDACIRARGTDAPLTLALPPHTNAIDKTPSFGEKRASIATTHRTTVFWSNLYPIVPPLQVDPLQAEQLWAPHTTAAVHWTPLWKRAMHGAGYADLPTSIQSYRTQVLGDEAEAGPLGIFGVRQRNPLDVVIALADQLNKPALLLHYVCAVVLQFYLSARNAFLCLRTDADAPFSTALPPHLFLMYRVNNWRIQEELLHSLPEVRSRADIDNEVLIQSFPLFLMQVFRWMQRTYPVVARLTHYGTHSKDEVQCFCMEKLRKNFLQALMCMRFREVVPVNMCERVNQSRGDTSAADCTIKFFPHPKAAAIRALDVKNTPSVVSERMPQFFCHLFFAPDRPVLLSPTVPRHVLWKLLLYYPLSDCDKTVATAARRIWGEPLYPTGGPWGEYDQVVPLNKLRARYTFYVRDEQLFAFVPNLLLPDNMTPYDEADVRYITPEQWKWAYERHKDDKLLFHDSTRFRFAQQGPEYAPYYQSAWRLVGRLQDCWFWYNPLTLNGPPLTPTECDIVSRELGKTDPKQSHHPYLLYWTLLRLAHSDIEAAAMLQRISPYTLADVQASYDGLIKSAESMLTKRFPSCADLLARMASVWDRCSATHEVQLCQSLDMEARSILSLSWRMLYPASVVRFGEQPWVASWGQADALPAITQYLTTLCDLTARIAPDLLKSITAKNRLDSREAALTLDIVTRLLHYRPEMTSKGPLLLQAIEENNKQQQDTLMH